MADLALVVSLMVLACLAVGPLAILLAVLKRIALTYLFSIAALLLGIYWIATINYLGIIPLLCAIYAFYRIGKR